MSSDATIDRDDADVSALGPGGDPSQPIEGDPAPPMRPPGGECDVVGPGQDEELLDSATIDALGKLSEAVEWVERARGALYEFHQLTGHADQLLEQAADALAAAGHSTWAAEIRIELVGRNVLDGRWTFQVVDEYDDTYWTPVRRVRSRAEEVLAGGRRHVAEARLKEQRRSHGRRHHESLPPLRPGRNRSDRNV